MGGVAQIGFQTRRRPWKSDIHIYVYTSICMYMWMQIYVYICLGGLSLWETKFLDFLGHRVSCIWPTHESKETNTWVKRDQHMSQKRPTTETISAFVFVSISSYWSLARVVCVVFHGLVDGTHLTSIRIHQWVSSTYIQKKKISNAVTSLGPLALLYLCLRAIWGGYG